MFGFLTMLAALALAALLASPVFAESNNYANVFEEADSVEVIDDYTVRITATEPNATFLTRLATFWGMVPPAYIREVGIDEFVNNPVGTGPFRFVSRAAGDRLDRCSARRDDVRGGDVRPRSRPVRGLDALRGRRSGRRRALAGLTGPIC